MGKSHIHFPPSLAAAKTALTSAKHVPRVGDPLLVHACTIKNGFVPVLTNDANFTFLVKGSDVVQCLRMSLGSSKPVQPQRLQRSL